MLLIRPSRAPSRRPLVPSAWRPRGRGRDSVPGPEGASNERLQTPFNNKHKLKINNSLIYSYALTRIFNHVSCGFLLILRAVDVPRGLILAPTHGLCNIDFYLLSRSAWTAWIFAHSCAVDSSPCITLLYVFHMWIFAHSCALRDTCADLRSRPTWIFAHSCAQWVFHVDRHLLPWIDYPTWKSAHSCAVPHPCGFCSFMRGEKVTV